MKSNKGEIEEEQLEELNFWRLSKDCNLQITPISKPEPNEQDLKSASFAESGYTPNSLLDISQDKRLIAMGNTKGFSIFSTTEFYSKLRQADGSVKQAYPSIWVHTRKGIPSHIKFFPDNERLLVVVRSYIQIYKISDILEKNHDASPIKEVDFKCESITKLAINHSTQDIRILVVFDGESIQLLDQDLNYRLIDSLKGAAVGFIEGDEDHFCIGHEDGSIKKHKMNGDEAFSFPLPIDIQATKAQLVEFQFVSSKYMISLHYSSDEDAYWFTLSVIDDDEITYFSSDTLIWPPTEGSALDQQFYISEIPNILPNDSQLFVLNFSCYDSSKYLKIDTKDGIQVTDISPNEKFAISHPVIEFNNDAESYPIGQILDLSVQGRIPNPGEDSDKDFSPRPILTILNNYGQCYSYDVIYEPNLKDESYTYKMADSIDHFTETNKGELSNIIWGHEIPETGFKEALELSAPTTPISAVNELDQDFASNTADQAAPKLTSQLTKESDYSLVSSNDDIADLSQVSDHKNEAGSTEKKSTAFEPIKEEAPIESIKQSQVKPKDDASAADFTKDKAKEESKPHILPTKKEIPKVTPTFKASEPLETLKKQVPVANQEDSDEDDDEVEPVKLEFEWPSLPTYPARPESPKLKETKEQVTSMIINLFKDKFNDKLKSTRTSLNSSGEQIMNFRDSSLSSTVSIGESELQDVAQWKQCLDKLIEAVKLKKANSSEWINQVTDAYNGWKQLNSFNQYIKEIKDDEKSTQIQLHKLTPQQIRDYSKMSDWNQSCNHLVNQLEELFAKIGDTRSDYEKVPTLEQINTVINSIESSIQTTKNSLTSQLVQIESLQSEIIQSNNKYLPHYFIPNQTSAPSSSKESNLDSVQISEAGKKLAQQRKSKLELNAQLLEVMQKHKPQWRKPMIKHSLVQPNISRQIPGSIKSHTFGSDELKDEMFASTNSLRQSSGSQSISSESI